ncbi:hypothetical protein Trydic_g21770 [Trypoxylus dichotomus]
MIEFLDVTCGQTRCSFMLTGTGVPVELKFEPDFLVCRLQTSPDEGAEATVEIINRCSADISLVFEKILDLQGDILMEQYKDKPQFDDQLSEGEISSLNNSFRKRRGTSYFKIIDEKMDIPAMKARTAKFYFGDFQRLEMKNATEADQSKKGKKDKKEDKKGKAKKKGRGSKESNDIMDRKYYVAKYNLLLSGSTFVKDFIVIGNFL